MRKSIFITFTLLLVGTFTVNAQTPGWGLRAGLNFSSFGADFNNSETRIGLHAGAFYQKTIISSFAIQPEATLSLEGDDDISFTNLNIGFMGKYYIERRFFVEFGPQFGFILGDDEAEAKTLNFSLGIGAGYQVLNNLGLGIRYHPGISDVFEDPPCGDNKVTNNNLQICAFLSF